MNRWLFAIVFAAALPAFAAAPAGSNAAPAASQPPAVSAPDPLAPTTRVFHERHGNRIRLLAQNTNCLSTTVSLTATLDNFVPSVPLPLTTQVSGDRPVLLVELAPVNATLPTHFQYHYRFRIGGFPDREPAPYSYAFPFLPAHAYTVWQGACGKFTHLAGSEGEQAIDFGLPEGSTVCAARPGVVVALRQDFTEGGVEERLKKRGNFITVEHDDHTCAEYVHLKPGGSLVKIGDTVKLGQPIALSGFTGYATGPHLHFQVSQNLRDGTARSLPALFTMGSAKLQPALEHHVYMAAPLPPPPSVVIITGAANSVADVPTK